MKKKNSALYYFAVFLIFLFCLGPIIWCFIISITPESEMLRQSAGILPESFTLENYSSICTYGTEENRIVMQGLINSLKIAAVTLVIGVPVTVATGYALSRYEFRGKKIFVNLLLLTIVIPVFTTIIPVYSIFRKFSLLDSMFWTSVIYISSALPLNVWIMMNYFKELPKELWQAASLDGFSEFQIFSRIILPLSLPAVVTVVLITFLMVWKQYIIPVILLSSYNNRTITMVMSEFMTRDMIRYGMISACGILAVLPPAAAAVIFRKFLMGNISSGSLK